MANQRRPTDLGEFELIEELLAELPRADGDLRLGPGDDAALTDPAGPTATSVDACVEGVHFRLPEFPLEAVGRKSLAAALSDLAAMGAAPRQAYVVLGLPDSLGEDDCRRIFAGIGESAKRDGVAIAGGDLTRCPVLVLALTVVGEQSAGAEFVTRSGARPGDAVVVSGEIGGAAAGLALLLGEEAPGEAVSSSVADALRAHQLDPRPRIAAGAALAAAGATAMIDVSDGLGGDAAQIARRSGVAVEIELDSLPLAAGTVEIAGEESRARELAAGGGEDFELLACLPEERLADARTAVEATGVALTRIGAVAGGDGVSLRAADGSELEPRGYDQLRGGS